MKLGRRLLLISLLVIIALILVVSVLRSGQSGSFWDGNVILTGEPFASSDSRDALVVFGRSTITIPEGVTVEGDAALISLSGETVQVNGRIGGDLTVLGADIMLGEAAVIEGDVSLLGRNLEVMGDLRAGFKAGGSTLRIAESAQIAGGIEACDFNAEDMQDLRSDAGGYVECEESLEFAEAPSFSLLGTGLFTLGLIGLSSLVVTVFPLQITQMEEAVRRRPRYLAGVGIAAFMLAVGITAAVIVALALLPGLGVLLIPLYLIVLAALGAAVLAGLVTLAMVLGDWTSRRLRLQTPPLITAMLGAFLLTLPLLLMSVLTPTAVVALIAILGLSTIGLGAALDTRLGTRDLERRYFLQG